MLERLPIVVGAGSKRELERPRQGSLDARIEVVELRSRALLLADGAMEGGQEKPHQRVFQDAEVGEDRLRVSPHISRNVRVVDDRPVRLRRDLEELSKRIESPDDLFGDDLFLQVGLRIRAEKRPSVFVAVQRVDPRQRSPAQRLVEIEGVPQLRDGEREQLMDEGPARQQIRRPAPELPAARSGERKPHGGALDQPMHHVQQPGDALYFVQQNPLHRGRQGSDLSLEPARVPPIAILGLRIQQIHIQRPVRVEGFPEVGGLARAASSEQEERVAAASVQEPAEHTVMVLEIWIVFHISIRNMDHVPRNQSAAAAAGGAEGTLRPR